MKPNPITDTKVKVSDIGVLILGFNRPELLKKRITQLSSTTIEHLYISIDGGPDSHTTNMEKVKQLARLKFNKQALHIFHNEKKMGLVLHITSAISKVLKRHNYVIVIEDDVILADNFIENMTSGLNFQKKCGQLGIVSGGSPIYSNKFNNKWRTIYTPSAWGWACSAKTWSGYKYDLGDTEINKHISESETWRHLNKTEKIFWLGKFNKIKKNPLYTWEYQLIFHLFKNNYASLAPIFSLTGNEGFGDTRAVHTQGNKPKHIANHRLNNRLITKTSKNPQIYKYLNKENWKNLIKSNFTKTINHTSKYLLKKNFR
jgi:hypothetical protein